LNSEHWGHLNDIVIWFGRVFSSKYQKGQSEHGGRMWEKPGIGTCLEQEVIDLVCYHKTMKDQMKRLFPEAYNYFYADPVD